MDSLSLGEIPPNSIPSSTKADQVEERIISYLKTGNFKPGDVIPKEEELALALGVSRPVIREAMSRLRMFGLVESRKRRGAILKQPDLFGALERVLLPKMLSEKTLQDIFELRLVLEMGLADFLFLRKTQKDLDELEVIVKKEAKHLEKKRTPSNIQILLECDINFHRKLYQISGNKSIQTFQRILLPAIRHVIDHQFQMDPLSYGSVPHLQLLEVLSHGTPEQFRLAMYKHLELHFQELNSIES